MCECELILNDATDSCSLGFSAQIHVFSVQTSVNPYSFHSSRFSEFGRFL